MENIDKSKRGSLFKFEVWISLILLVVTLWSFTDTMREYMSGAEETTFAPIKFFMLSMVFISFLILLMNNGRKKESNSFLWFAVSYAFVGMFSTLICGLYPMEEMPFKFVRLSYWVSVLIISYYSVLHLNTLKFHVFIVGVFLPVLFYFFLTVANTYQRYYDGLALNPVFYMSFLMPAILLIRKKTLKISGLLLIFAAILISYKRSAFLAFVTSVPVYLYARNAISMSAKLKKLALITFGGAFLLLLLFFTFNYIADTLDRDLTSRLESLTDDEGSGRLDKYIGYMGLLGSQSLSHWIIGGGANATNNTKYTQAHNDFIEVLYNFGLMGLMFYLLFLNQLAKLFFEMKKYKYIHFDAFAVSLVIFFWGSMFSILIVLPYWFLNLAFFWGWVIADFHNAKRFGDPTRITNPL